MIRALQVIGVSHELWLSMRVQWKKFDHIHIMKLFKTLISQSRFEPCGMLQPSKLRILDSTVNYIKCLEEEAERLEGLKKFQSKQHRVERPSLSKCTDHNSVNVTISDSAVFLAIQLPSRQGSVLNILRVLQRHEAEVMEARINVSDEKVMTFTATVKLGGHGGRSIDKMRQDILTSLDLLNRS